MYEMLQFEQINLAYVLKMCVGLVYSLTDA